MEEKEYTLDILAGGKIRLFQSLKGYRCAIDAFLLAHFVRLKKKEWVLELGTGNGIVALLLALKHAYIAKVIGIEIQTSLAQLAQKNVRANHLEDLINVIQADMKDVPWLFPQKKFDVVVSNPPYYSLGAGRINPIWERAVARHEIKASVIEVTEVSQKVLKKRGRLYLIYPASRVGKLVTILESFKMVPKRLRFVYPFQNSQANFVLVEAIKEGGAETLVLPPLIIYKEKGKYTSEVAEYYK